MTHFNPAIEALLKSKPKSKSDRKARRRALAILYGAERRERRTEHKTGRRRKQAKLSDNLAIRFGQQFRRNYKEDAEEYRRRGRAVKSFAGFISRPARTAIERRVERRRAIKRAEFEITQKKENARYVHIDPKQTHKQAIAQVDRGVTFEVSGTNPPPSTITGKPKNVIIQSETT